MAYHGKFKDCHLMIQQNPYMNPIVAWAEYLGMCVVRGGGKGYQEGTAVAMERFKGTLHEARGRWVWAWDGQPGFERKARR